MREPDATGVGSFIAEGCNEYELARGRVVTTPSCSAQLQLDPASSQRWPGTRAGLST